MKVYTKGGDKGRTSLIGGERVLKTDCRVEAYGSVDELIAFTALLADKLLADEKFSAIVAQLRRVESQLMTVSALFAVGKGGEGKIAPIADERVEELERAIDAMQAEIPAITKFTIPGGHRTVSLCHICRTVCRRAFLWAVILLAHRRRERFRESLRLQQSMRYRAMRRFSVTMRSSSRI